jgi:RAB protein geranylgeranyltransferase component A
VQQLNFNKEIKYMDTFSKFLLVVVNANIVESETKHIVHEKVVEQRADVERTSCSLKLKYKMGWY